MSEFKITPLQRGQITRAINTLNRVRGELEKNNPAAPNVNWYLEGGGNLNLMCDDTHSGSEIEPNSDESVGLWGLDNASGGSW